MCCWCCGCALACKAVLINTGVFAAGDVLDLHVAYIRAKWVGEVGGLAQLSSTRPGAWRRVGSTSVTRPLPCLSLPFDRLTLNQRWARCCPPEVRNNIKIPITSPCLSSLSIPARHPRRRCRCRRRPTVGRCSMFAVPVRTLHRRRRLLIVITTRRHRRAGPAGRSTVRRASTSGRHPATAERQWSAARRRLCRTTVARWVRRCCSLRAMVARSISARRSLSATRWGLRHRGAPASTLSSTSTPQKRSASYDVAVLSIKRPTSSSDRLELPRRRQLTWRSSSRSSSREGSWRWRCRWSRATVSRPCRRLLCATSAAMWPASAPRYSCIPAPCRSAAGRVPAAVAEPSSSCLRAASCPSTSRRSSSAKAR